MRRLTSTIKKAKQDADADAGAGRLAAASAALKAEEARKPQELRLEGVTCWTQRIAFPVTSPPSISRPFVDRAWGRTSKRTAPL